MINRQAENIEWALFCMAKIQPFIISLVCIYFISSIGVAGATIVGVPPNPSGDTIINQNTTWDEENNIILGGNVIVGNASQRIYFNITNSIVTTPYAIRLNGIGYAVNFSMDNSIIEFNSTIGSVSRSPDFPGTINTSQLIYVNTTLTLSDASRFILTNSTIKGKNATRRANGFYIESGGNWGMNPLYPQAKHTIITNNMNFSYLGGIVGGTVYYAFSTGYALENDSEIANITLYYDGTGIKPSEITDVRHITSIGGETPFAYGRNWLNLIMTDSVGGFEKIADYGIVSNGYFKSNQYKLNMGYTSSHTIFENSTFILCACNAGDGSYSNSGFNNTIRYNIFNYSGVGSRRNKTSILNNVFINGGMPTAGNKPLRVGGWNATIRNNSINKGVYGLELYSHPQTADHAEGHIVDSNRINGSNTGIYIIDTKNSVLMDNIISNTTNYDIAIASNTFNIKWINNLFNNSKLSIITTFDNYYYSDILVQDSDGVPINNATISISNDVNSSYPSINRAGVTLASATTDASGHTPLPINNDSTTIVLANMSKNSTVQQMMKYTISAYDPSHLYTSTPTLIFPNGTLHSLSPLATATVSPNSSWYRPNPNTYQNTTVIQIDRERTNITLKFNNGSITVSNATQTRFDATTDYHQSYVIINNTVPGFANKNLSFTADGITYANSTADSKGFVSFNYTGTWSKHTFEWVMESDKIVNILDLVLVAQHFGEETSAPYPNYDANEDGKVDISDVVLVAREVF